LSKTKSDNYVSESEQKFQCIVPQWLEAQGFTDSGRVLFSEFGGLSSKYIQQCMHSEAIYSFAGFFIFKTGEDNDTDIVSVPPHDEYGFITPTEFKHHKFQELEEQLQLLASNYPNITRLYDIGSSVEGRKLYVMEISDKPGTHEPGEALLLFVSENAVILSCLNNMKS
jgi:hypothetical protein